MLWNSESILTSVSTSLWKGPDICLILSEGAQKCALVFLSPHAQLLPGGATCGRDGLGLVGIWMPYPYGEKQCVICASAKRQVSGAVNLLLLHPFRLPGNPSQVVVWVWLLRRTFGSKLA